MGRNADWLRMMMRKGAGIGAVEWVPIVLTMKRDPAAHSEYVDHGMVAIPPPGKVVRHVSGRHDPVARAGPCTGTSHRYRPRHLICCLGRPSPLQESRSPVTNVCQSPFNGRPSWRNRRQSPQHVMKPTGGGVDCAAPCR
ncbi:hypothetical protein [Paracoccus sp. Ld10]|uniref:hypothetical protein n=1 Tax=Paracoccus sp. Ld10 TaxID=649158 RepID=UPI00386B09C0